MWPRCLHRCRHRGVLAGTVGVLGFACAATVVSLPDVEPASTKDKTSNNTESIITAPARSPEQPLMFQEAIDKSRILIKEIKERSGTPGIVVGVSVDGRSVWQEGFGYSDLENGLPCTPNTVMRIASISKSITMAVVALLWEKGLLDLDKPVHEYVPHFPKKTYTQDGKEKTTFMTSRHLASHQSGIRHYSKSTKDEAATETDLEEARSKDKFKTVADSLKIFQDDPLRFEPGTHFLYTTYGFTLLSAVVEAVSQEPFCNVARRLFATMGLKHTYLDENEPLIYNRSRFYSKNKKGELENSPYVDSSYKWAGGGFLSNVGDLLRFGNVMLYAAGWQPIDGGSGRRCNDASYRCPPGFLKSDTVKTLWTPTKPMPKSDTNEFGWNYGLGWTIAPQRPHFGMCGSRPKKIVSHDGGAMGASSTLVLRLPDVENKEQCAINGEDCLPRGVVVAMITNLSGVHLRRVAINIAELFDRSP